MSRPQCVRRARVSGPCCSSSRWRVELGGFPQTVLLRGADRRKPVLLYVHGGPGSA